MTLEQLLQEWAGHDLNHTIQAEQALMQPFITRCGPWRKYFADHDLALKKYGKDCPVKPLAQTGGN